MATRSVVFDRYYRRVKKKKLIKLNFKEYTGATLGIFFEVSQRAKIWGKTPNCVKNLGDGL